MKFVFWQNIISIHQSAFIKALSEAHDVTLIAAESIDKDRTKEKWKVPDMGNARVVVSPSESEIELHLTNEAYHVFSGIDAYPMVFKAFKMAVGKNLNISVMAEPYEWAGVKGALRRLKYALLNMRFGKHISHMFTTGNRGIWSYRRAGFPASKLHQWGYFTEQSDVALPEDTYKDRKVCLLYVGRLDQNKNIVPILERFAEYGDNVERFTIVGDGPLFDKCKTLADRNSKIKILGRLPNDQATAVMASHDYLVLPSLYDGWGAVVNEALANGTRVLCSEACGASILLDGEKRGEAFSQENAMAVLKKWCGKGPVNEAERKEIRDWARRSISGQAASQYFLNVIQGKSEMAPWLFTDRK